MISLSCLKRTEAVVFRITNHCSASVISQPAGIAGADSGYPDSFSMRLMLTQFLNVPFSP